MHGDRSLAQEARDRRHVALEQGIETVGGLEIAVEEGLDVRAPDRQRMAGQHHVARLRIELRHEVEHERIGRRLVEQMRAARGGEQAGVEQVRVRAQRLEVVGLAARKPRDELADRRPG